MDSKEERTATKKGREVRRYLHIHIHIYIHIHKVSGASKLTRYVKNIYCYIRDLSVFTAYDIYLSSDVHSDLGSCLYHIHNPFTCTSSFTFITFSQWKKKREGH